MISKNTLKATLFVASMALLLSCSPRQQTAQQNYLSFSTPQELHEYFSYKGDNSIVVSGHRGGRERYFPENCIEGFQNVLDQMPAFFEIDPRLTKDSVIVLMHDATLDRTTTATGKLSDYTWAELDTVRLKDSQGNVTDFKIPQLADVIEWGKGKTVLNLDKKDVPMQMIADLIRELGAQNHVMLTVHNGEQAKFYHDLFEDIMMSAFSRNDVEYGSLLQSGVPWGRMIAYVGRTIDDGNRHIVDSLHRHGVRCMVSFAPTHDKLQDAKERAHEYKAEVEKRPDIIESDIPTEVWSVIRER